MARITAQMLRELGACNDQTSQFEALYPDGAEINTENGVEGVRLGLNLNWGVRLLSVDSALELGDACFRSCGVQIDSLKKAAELLWLDSTRREKHAARAYIFCAAARAMRHTPGVLYHLIVEASHAAGISTDDGMGQMALLAEFVARELDKGGAK